MVLIQNVEVVDVEEGQEHTFEDCDRIYSLKRTTFTPNFIDSIFVSSTYLTEVFDPENFTDEDQIATIIGNLWRCRSVYVGCAVFGCDSIIYYREQFKKTFMNWIDSMVLNHPRGTKWFHGSKKKINYIFNRMGLGFHLIHNRGISFNSFEHDLVLSSTGLIQFMTLTDAGAEYAPKFFRLDLMLFIELYLTCIFRPVLKPGQTLVETSVEDPISLEVLFNEPSRVADLLGLDKEVLLFLDQARVAYTMSDFPEDLMFGHPMFYGIKEKMKYQEMLCTEYLGDPRDKTVYLIDQEFYYWRESFENKEVEKRVWFVLKDRMKRAGKTDFEKFKKNNKFKFLFKDFCMLYYNTKKHMERVVGAEEVVNTGERLRDDEIYTLVDELLGGGTITEIHGRLMKFWFNDPDRLNQLLAMMTFF